MRTFLVALVCAGSAMLGVLPAAADEDERRSVAVTGVAERRVTPDMARLRLAVSQEALDVSSAREAADETIARAIAVLRSADVDDDDINASSLQVSPQYRWNDTTRERRLVGYRVTRGLDVRLLDLDRLGTLLVELSNAGINEIQEPELALRSPEAVYQEVLAAAAANARERAEVLATSLGEELGAVISVHTQSQGGLLPMRREAFMMAADSAASGAPSYQSGNLDLRVELQVVFALDD
jgi:uncharacterized protein YggE